MNCPDRPLVMVRFVDSSHRAEWEIVKERNVATDDLDCWLVGWLISESDTAIAVSAALSTCGDDEQGTLEMVVPKASIVDWWELE